MRHRTNRTRWQQFQQRIIDWLLSLDAGDVGIALWMAFLVFLLVLAVMNDVMRPSCAEGYVYMRGICVQGYRP